MKALLIIAQKGFQDHEYSETKDVLEDSGVKTTTASITADYANGKFGMIVMPDIAVKDAKAGDYDVIVVIGGPGAPELAKHKEVLDLLRTAKQKSMNLAAICIAPTVLAKAGVLEGKKSTVWKSPESIKILEQGKAIFVDKPVVVDSKLVTGNGPDAATEFGRKIVEMLRQ